jgi:beta-galactosidase
VKYEPGVLEVVVYKNGKEWARDKVKTTGKATKLSLESENQSIVSDGEDICYMNVSIRDAEGLIVPRLRNKVEFSITGPGEIVAVDNGDETDFDDFHQPARKVFNGWAQVIVRAKPNVSGVITVTAKSTNLQSSSASVKVIPPMH